MMWQMLLATKTTLHISAMPHICDMRHCMANPCQAGKDFMTLLNGRILQLIMSIPSRHSTNVFECTYCDSNRRDQTIKEKVKNSVNHYVNIRFLNKSCLSYSWTSSNSAVVTVISGNMWVIWRDVGFGKVSSITFKDKSRLFHLVEIRKHYVPKYLNTFAVRKTRMVWLLAMKTYYVRHVFIFSCFETVCDCDSCCQFDTSASRIEKPEMSQYTRCGKIK